MRGPMGVPRPGHGPGTGGRYTETGRYGPGCSGVISDYNDVGWVPGQYAKQAATGAKEWYPGKYVVVGPTERAIERQTEDMKKWGREWAPILGITISALALAYSVWRFRK